HHGALLAPGRRNPLEQRVENWVAGQRPPGRFDEYMAQATDALAADVAPPNRPPSRLLTGRQARVTEQGPLIRQASLIPRFRGQGPCPSLPKAWEPPIDFFHLLPRLGLTTQQGTHLEELACGKAPLLSQQRETGVVLRGQRPRRNLP